MTRFSPMLILPALGVLTLAALTYSLTVRSAPAPAPAARAAESAFYCDRDALNPAERARHFDVLGPSLRDKRLAVRELPDGYEFRFATDAKTYKEVTEWIDGERRC